MNIGISKNASIISKTFKDLVNVFINSEPECWNVHVLMPLYKSTYKDGLSFSLISTDTDNENIGFGNGMTRIDGFTAGVNTGCLVTVICWIYKFVTTGDPSPIPRLQPAY